MKKIKTIALSLIAALSVGTVPSFAAISAAAEPIDPNNPTVTYSYTCVDGKNCDRLSFTTKGISGIKLVLNGRVISQGKEEIERNRTSEGWAVSGATLYKLHNLSDWTPGVYKFADGETPDYTGASYGYTAELVPTTEIPEKSMTETERHNTVKQNITEKYLVDGSELNESAYEKAKTGAYTEYRKKKYIDSSEKLDKAETTFLGLAEISTTRNWTDGSTDTVTMGTFKFRRDEYYTVTQNYIRTYEIVHEKSSNNTNSSAGSTKQETGASSASNSVDASQKTSSQKETASQSKTDTSQKAAGSSTEAKSSDASKSSNAKKSNFDAKVTDVELTVPKKGAGKVNTTVVIESETVKASDINKALKSKKLAKSSVKTIVLGKDVKKISKSAFKGYKNAKTLVVKTKKLKKASVKYSLKGSKITKIQVKVGSKKTNKKYVKTYKKIFTKKNAGRSVKIA